MRSLAGLIAANVLLALLGSGALLVTGTWDRLRPASRIGPALLAGCALAVVLLPPLIYAGLSPTPVVVAAITAAVLALGVLVRRRRERPQVAPSGHGFLAAAIVALLLLPLALRAAFEPLVKFDAYANWSLKAKLLYGHGGLVLGGLDDRMSSAFYAVSHREYPIGLPALEAFDFHAMGGADAQTIHLQFVVVLAAFMATAWSLLRPRADVALLTGALCLLVAAPSLHTQVLAAYADVPLACLWVAAAAAVGLWPRDGRGDLLALGALFAAGALAIKQEGIVLDVALFAVAAVVLVAAREPARLRRLAARGVRGRGDCRPVAGLRPRARVPRRRHRAVARPQHGSARPVARDRPPARRPARVAQMAGDRPARRGRRRHPGDASPRSAGSLLPAPAGGCPGRARRRLPECPRLHPGAARALRRARRDRAGAALGGGAAAPADPAGGEALERG